jgi:type VI secretion system protein ImpC
MAASSPPDHCPVCGTKLRIDPADPGGHASCPRCANLLSSLLEGSTPARAPAEPPIGARNHMSGEASRPGVSGDHLTTIRRWMAEIDRLLSAQLDEILHDPDFQRLEATWRGLHYLVHQSETAELLKIRILNVSKRELFEDTASEEPGESVLFCKVYEEPYEPSGQPFGMFLLDYEFGRHPQDVAVLQAIACFGAWTHAPFIAGASSALLGLHRFTELPSVRNLTKVFDGADYAPWKAFRESDEARYVALTLPRVLARYPYGKKFTKVDAFDFEENVDGRDHDRYLWMNAAWAYGTLITGAFARRGWMAQTRGVRGGKIEGLSGVTRPAEVGDVALRCPLEIAIDSDRRELELSNLGLLPLVWSRQDESPLFLGSDSCQKPKDYFDADARASAIWSAKIHVILCASRFIQCINRMTRDAMRHGLTPTSRACQDWLNGWIQEYVLSESGTFSPEMQVTKPLAAARVQVEDLRNRRAWQLTLWLKLALDFDGPTPTVAMSIEIP